MGCGYDAGKWTSEEDETRREKQLRNGAKLTNSHKDTAEDTTPDSTPPSKNLIALPNWSSYCTCCEHLYTSFQ